MSSPDLLLHPVRLRIVQALLRRALTPLELRDVLGDVPQATLYRHVNALADGGVLQVVEEHPVRGGVERRYAVVEDAAVVGAADLADADPATHVAHFTTFLATMLSSFTRSVQRPDLDLAADGIGYRLAPLWLDDEEFTAFVSALREVILKHYDNEPRHGRRRRLLYTVLFPDADAGTSALSDPA